MVLAGRTFTFRRAYDFVGLHGALHPGGVRHRHPVSNIVARKPERPGVERVDG